VHSLQALAPDPISFCWCVARQRSDTFVRSAAEWNACSRERVIACGYRFGVSSSSPKGSAYPRPRHSPMVPSNVDAEAASAVSVCEATHSQSLRAALPQAVRATPSRPPYFKNQRALALARSLAKYRLRPSARPQALSRALCRYAAFRRCHFDISVSLAIPQTLRALLLPDARRGFSRRVVTCLFILCVPSSVDWIFSPRVPI
jgi:hypothetical protein